METRLKINVNISKLLEHLESNKAQHIEDYHEANKNYFIMVTDQLTEMTRSATSNEFRDDLYQIRLQPPKNEADKYDKYIDMLGMSRDETIEIGTDDYNRFVNDEWNWAISAKLLNSTYMSDIGQ